MMIDSTQAVMVCVVFCCWTLYLGFCLGVMYQIDKQHKKLKNYGN